MTEGAEGTIPERAAVAVEYPGRVENDSVALETLKGDVKGGTLSLTWQLGNPVAHPVRAEKSAFKGLLLRISERGAAQVAATVETVYRFEELCDFAYTPARLQTDDFAKAATGVSPQGRQFEKLVTEEPYFSSEPLLTVAPRFSKIRYSTDALVKGKTVPVHVMKGHITPLCYFTTPDVPSPSDAASEVEEWRCAEEAFEERPIWSKHMIAWKLASQLSHQERISFLRHHCYRFGDGPWQKLWIRKGYDPRTDPDARTYQAVSYTIPQTWYFRAAKSTKLSSLREMMQRHTIDQMNRFEAWPIEKTTQLQLCDLEDASIQSLLDDRDQISGSCEADGGWLVPEAWQQIQTIVQQRFNTALEQILRTAEEQVPEGESTEGESVLASFLTAFPGEAAPSEDQSSSGGEDSMQLDLP